MKLVKLWTNVRSCDRGDILAKDPTEVVYPSEIYNRDEVDQILTYIQTCLEGAMSEIEDGSSNHAHGVLADIVGDIEELLG